MSDNDDLRPRNSVREGELAKRLRGMSSDEAYDVICRLIEQDYPVGLELANRCLRETRHFLKILEQGILRWDATSARYWIESSLPRLGHRRLLSFLLRCTSQNPSGVAKALYWAKINTDRNDSTLREQIRRIEDILLEKV